MALSLKHSVRTANIVIISRTGQEIGYIVPVDLVLFLLWFLGSYTAQALAMTWMAAFYRLRQGWLWLTDWPAWIAGVEVLIEDFRNLGRMVYV